MSWRRYAAARLLASGWRARRAAAVALARHIGRDAGFLVGAAVFVEALFGLPGLGTLLLDSIYQGDYPVGEAVLLFGAATAIALHLAVDLVVAALAQEARTT